jgi:RNA polymerase sigma factor (sigma-70 family)
MGRGANQGELETLYRCRFDEFLRVAAAITGDDALAHDAVQDGFARALRSASSFRSEAPLEAWVWRIVINAARDARPAQHVELVADPPDRAQGAGSQNGSSGGFGGWIAALPERQRLAVFLRYAADLDYRSIALALGVEVGTVSATLHAAHERLRRSIEEVRP